MTFEHRFGPDMPLYFGVKKDARALHLSEYFGDATLGAALRIEVGDVWAYAKELNAKKYRNARHGMQHQPWGWDDMPNSDPNGNKLIFCTAHGD